MPKRTNGRAASHSVQHNRLTTTIKREFLAAIVAGTKRIEYREIKPYWTQRFEARRLPFELRLRNGYAERVPEVTVLIHRIVVNKREGEYELHIRTLLHTKYWNARTQQPRL